MRAAVPIMALMPKPKTSPASACMDSWKGAGRVDILGSAEWCCSRAFTPREEGGEEIASRESRWLCTARGGQELEQKVR